MLNEPDLIKLSLTEPNIPNSICLTKGVSSSLARLKSWSQTRVKLSLAKLGGALQTVRFIYNSK